MFFTPAPLLSFLNLIIPSRRRKTFVISLHYAWRMRWFPKTLNTLLLLLVGCTAMNTQNTTPTPYPDLGPAPELTNTVWLNTPAPLRLADLRGKVVLLDMWTFG